MKNKDECVAVRVKLRGGGRYKTVFATVPPVVLKSLGVIADDVPTGEFLLEWVVVKCDVHAQAFRMTGKPIQERK